MADRGQERPLWLTMEEAMGLLDILVLTPAELSDAQQQALQKLGTFYRQGVHETDENVPALYLRAA